MTTIAVVRRFGKAVIAADSAISFGDVALPYGPRTPRKIIKSGAA